MERLRKEGNNDYFITKTVPFRNNTMVSQQDLEACFNFAYGMTFGQVGEHRNYRSGGQVRRKNGEIFIDTFQGKLAEYGFYNYFKDKVKAINSPDLEQMQLNVWDTCDFSINKSAIAIKSTKFYGNLLLLETKDWDLEGKYIPNKQNGHSIYDYFVLVRVRPEGSSIMKKNRWLYSDFVQKTELYNAIMSEKWDVNLVGFISRQELIDVISSEMILPQNAMLNGKTKMDAENYYVQSGDMHNISELIELIADE